jgi:predicted nucleotidyltransferase
MVTKEIVINTAKSFVSECLAKGLVFHKVLLFGSASRDEMHEWSDIDLLLVSDQFNDNVFDNLKLYSIINIRYPIIETHPYPTSCYYSGDPFIEEVLKNSIEII